MLRLHEQLRARDRLQHARPDRDDVIGDLRELAEIAEGRMAAREHRQRADVDRLGRRREAKIAVRQMPRPLGEMRGLGGRQHVTVADHVVDRAHAGAREITGPARLQRRGLPREQRQAVVDRVARRVEQHVDAVRADTRGRRFVAQAGNAGPRREGRLDAGGHVVLDVARRVRMHLDPVRVEMLQHALDEIADRMRLQVARHDADLERPPGAGGQVDEPVRPRRRAPRDDFVVARGFGEIGVVVERFAAVAREQQVAARLRQFGAQRDRVPVRLERGRNLVQVEQRIRKVVVGLAVVRLQRDGLAERIDGRAGVAGEPQRVAEVVVRIDVVGSQLDGETEALGGGGVTVVRLHHVAEVVVIDRVRLDLDRRHDQVGCLLITPVLMADQAEEVKRVRVPGIGVEDPPVQRLGLFQPVGLMVRQRLFDRGGGGGGGHHELSRPGSQYGIRIAAGAAASAHAFARGRTHRRSPTCPNSPRARRVPIWRAGAGIGRYSRYCEPHPRAPGIRAGYPRIHRNAG